MRFHVVEIVGKIQALEKNNEKGQRAVLWLSIK